MKNGVGFFKESLRIFVSLIFCLGIFLEDVLASDKYKVLFHASSKEQSEKIKNYYKNEYPEETYKNLYTDEFDLNGDKRNELFVYYSDSFNCGTAGCNTEIFSFDRNNKIKNIFSSYTYGEIYVLDSKKDGFRNLDVAGGTQHVKNKDNLFRWDSLSQKYQYQK